MSSKAVQRITRKDIPSANNDDMRSNGIYYFPRESNIMKGTALIVGPKGTPYYGGFWFFDITFSEQHPFEPPTVLSLTQDERTRFNPNLYRNGKVCLSLLGTWHQGDKWTAVQTLGSVLLSILGMVLNDVPLRNEPCFASFDKHEEFEPYNRIIFHANIELMICYLKDIPTFAGGLQDIRKIMNTAFEERRADLVKECRALSEVWDGKSEHNNLFRLSQKYHFGKLADQIIALQLPA